MNAKKEEIPGMNLENKYNSKNILPQQNIQEELNKLNKDFEKVKDQIVKKYEFTQAISILSKEGIKKLITEEEVPKETENFIHLYMIIPEDQFKEIAKIKKEIVDGPLKDFKEKVWLNIKTPVDVWELCFDGKGEIFTAISMSYPLYDKGILESLRLAEIHKTLVLQKFEKYVVSYVLGGSLARGDAIATSDVDVFVIINDTDVKRMSRLELKERLRGIIYKYISEATVLAGAKKSLLNVQVYLLTEFWESVKDAHPVMFTFIRDGVPIYDRGTFMPWKALLKMGKLRPSPESIDNFMAIGDSTIKRAKKALMDIAILDIYHGVVTPSQALLMLAGSPPPSPKNLVMDMKKIFCEKEKILEMKYIKTVEEIVKFYKDYEHEKVKEITGAKIDKMIKNSEDYLKRLKELRKQIDKRAQEKTIEQIYNDIIGLLKPILGNRNQEDLKKEFKEKLVKKGKFTEQHLKILDHIFLTRKEFKKGKLDSYKVDDARKNASILINELIEYSQRKDLITEDKSLKIKTNKTNLEIVNTKKGMYIIDQNQIKKISGKKIVDSNQKEFEEAIAERINFFSQSDLEVVKKEFGDYEIIL